MVIWHLKRRMWFMVLQQLKFRFESNSFPHANYCHHGYIGLGHYDDGYMLEEKKTHKLSSMQFHMISQPPDGCSWDVHYNNCVNLRRNWTKELESSLTFSMICKHRARFQHTTLIGLPHLDPKKSPRSLTFVLDSSGGKTMNFQRNLTLLHLGWSKTRGGVILQFEHVPSCRRSNYWSNCRKTLSRSWIMANGHGEQSKHCQHSKRKCQRSWMGTKIVG